MPIKHSSNPIKVSINPKATEEPDEENIHRIPKRIMEIPKSANFILNPPLTTIDNHYELKILSFTLS